MSGRGSMKCVGRTVMISNAKQMRCNKREADARLASPAWHTSPAFVGIAREL